MTWVYPPSDTTPGASELEIRLTPSGDEATDARAGAHRRSSPTRCGTRSARAPSALAGSRARSASRCYLRTGSTVDDPEAWQLSDEGRAYSKGGSEGWGAASLAAGVDPEVVERNIAATTAFYTGEQAPGA